MDAETHNIPPAGCRIKIREAFQWGSGGWEAGASLHTTKSIAHVIVGVVFKVSSNLYDLFCESDC